MKRSLFFILTFTLLAFASNAFAAAGTLVKDKSKLWVPVQSVQGLSPVPAASACTTSTGTKGTIVTVNPAGYLALRWIATDAVGAPVVIKRFLNSNTAFMPLSGDTVTINSDITGVTYKKYSTASPTTITVCVEMQ